MATLRTMAAKRFEAYVAKLAEAVGHADREAPLRAYLSGLLLPGHRKSVEPMAARVGPRRAGALHQSMHHFVANAEWDDLAVLRIARDEALRELERHAPVMAWVLDDTTFPKKGRVSVGVARQYCGARGRPEGCQAAVTISLANETMSVPAAFRLYLPKEWTGDRKRCRAAGVPRSVRFMSKWAIALAEIDRLRADGVPEAPVVADAWYGCNTEFREELARRGLAYMLGVKLEAKVWGPDETPQRPRRGTATPAAASRRPMSISDVAAAVPEDAWQTVRWRQGARDTLEARFVALRVRAAHGYARDAARRPVEWLLIQEREAGETVQRAWLSNAEESASLENLVRLAKCRWRVERDYQEMKDELGLDHYEGRGWRGFHHHATLCIAAYAYLAAERARLSPPQVLSFLRAPRLPKGFRPRGSPRARRTT
jgi:SRSO17 transposase